jgi:hypothetical protein
MDRLKAENAGPVGDERAAPTEDEVPVEEAGEGGGDVVDDQVDEASADSIPAGELPETDEGH